MKSLQKRGARRGSALRGAGETPYSQRYSRKSFSATAGGAKDAGLPDANRRDPRKSVESPALHDQIRDSRPSCVRWAGLARAISAGALRGGGAGFDVVHGRVLDGQSLDGWSALEQRSDLFGDFLEKA